MSPCTSTWIALKKDHNLGANTILHNAIIVAQFFKRQGRGGITRGLQLPERITPLPREYRTADLAKFFKAAYDSEKALFSTFLLTGLRELEVVHLFWTDVSFDLQTVRVTAKPELGFYPKRWEEREVPIPVQLIGLLKSAPPPARLQFRVFLAERESGIPHARPLQGCGRTRRTRKRPIIVLRGRSYSHCGPLSRHDTPCRNAYHATLLW